MPTPCLDKAVLAQGGAGVLLYELSRHINGTNRLANMRHILRIPQVSTPYATDGTDGHGVREMCHKEREMGTMVERIQPVSQSRSPSPFPDRKGAMQKPWIRAPYQKGPKTRPSALPPPPPHTRLNPSAQPRSRCLKCVGHQPSGRAQKRRSATDAAGGQRGPSWGLRTRVAIDTKRCESYSRLQSCKPSNTFRGCEGLGA